jgi:hypothetical protein
MLTLRGMSTSLNRRGLLLAGLLAGCGAADADYEPPALPPPPPPIPSVEPAPMPEPYSPSSQAEPAPTSSPSQAAPSPPALPPPPPDNSVAASPPPPPAGDNPTTYVQTYPSGQWVYLADRGWIWVPSGTATVESDGVPYVYLYTPAAGWTWYVSPWGRGPYRYGPWIRHPWHPVGWHGYWVAYPHVVVRLGPRHYHR